MDAITQMGVEGSVKPLETKAILARIRCFQQCIESFRNSSPLPKSLWYVPGEVEYKIHPSIVARATRSSSGSSGRRTPRSPRVKLTVYAVPDKECPPDRQRHVHCGKSAKIVGSGEEMCNNFGSWIRLSLKASLL